MTRIDIPTMAAQLNLLAEVFERKPISEKAALVWFDTMKDFPIERLTGLLIEWPKTHIKFPAPAEVWKAMNDLGVSQREQRARAENRATFQPGVGGEKAQAFIASIRSEIGRARWTPLDHWKRVYATAKPGSIGHRYAEEVLSMRGALTEREPGEDDDLAA